VALLPRLPLSFTSRSEPEGEQKLKPKPHPSSTKVQERISKLFSAFPPDVTQRIQTGSKDAIKAVLQKLPNVWQAQTQRFGSYGISFENDIVPLLMDAALDFFNSREIHKGIDQYIQSQKQYAAYKRAVTLLSAPAAPFSSQLKQALQREFALVTGSLPAPLNSPQSFTLAIESTLGIPKSKKILDADVTKSPHKHPAIVELMDTLYARLIAKGVSGYRAARLLHGLALDFGLFQGDTPPPEPDSFHRHLRRRKK
jgi:hypothetical protein